MSLRLSLYLFIGTISIANAHFCQDVIAETNPQNAYATYCLKPVPVYAAPKKQRVLNRMAYVNPPASQIFNHPARGMKHPRYDNVQIVSGTPQRSYVYPYSDLRAREPLPEWPVR